MNLVLPGKYEHTLSVVYEEVLSEFFRQDLEYDLEYRR